ncbi:MAG: MBL fold metallo-hydrolase [Planctomycetes bacterium]|nr:MBL fold metallo-hydrolase [Planctomycetota bacterium]
MSLLRAPWLAAVGFSALFALGLGLRPAASAQDVSVKSTPVSGGVHLLVGVGGNVGVLCNDYGVLVVDDQMAPTEEPLLDAIDALSKAPWRFVLNTHHHGDHTGNNASFGARAPIVAHENARTRLTDPQRRNGPLVAPGVPVITYADGLALHFGDERVRVVHYANAHTDGDSVVYFERANVVHMGDLFFQGRFPFVDLDSGGSVAGVVRAVERVLAEIDDATKVIPGHGALATKRELAAYRDVLVDCLKLVGDAKAAKKSLATLKSERTLKKYESLAWEFVGEERFLETVARELGVE